MDSGVNGMDSAGSYIDGGYLVNHCLEIKENERENKEI